MRRPQDVGGNHPSRGGSGDEPGGQIAAGEMVESLGRRCQASQAEVFRTSACTRERRPSPSLIGYTSLRNRMTLTCVSITCDVNNVTMTSIKCAVMLFCSVSVDVKMRRFVHNTVQK